MKKQTIGVLTEQGYAAGQFGFEPLNEQDQQKVKKPEDKSEDK